MKKLFQNISDINNTVQKYPTNLKYVALAFTSDFHYFIYALYTKRDLSNPKLIEISEDSYFSIRDNFISNGVSELSFPSAAALEGYITVLRLKSTTDLSTIGDLLNLT